MTILEPDGIVWVNGGPKVNGRCRWITALCIVHGSNERIDFLISGSNAVSRLLDTSPSLGEDHHGESGGKGDDSGRVQQLRRSGRHRRRCRHHHHHHRRRHHHRRHHHRRRPQIELMIFDTLVRWIDFDREQRYALAPPLMGEVVHLEALSVQQLVEVVEGVGWLFEMPGVRDILTSIYKFENIIFIFPFWC